MTCLCKKCRAERPVGTLCPVCGGKLSSPHLTWQVSHDPAKDWIAWNSVMRILLPAAAATLLLLAGGEAVSGGWAAVERLMHGPFPAVLGVLLVSAVLITLLFLLARGEDTLEVLADNRGVTVRTWLPRPSAMRLIARQRPVGLMQQFDDAHGVLVGEAFVPWKDIARVQLWPEKDLVLLYSPRWWLRAAVPCTPLTWDDMLFFVSDKLGKKKKVRLPDSLRTLPMPRKAAASPAPASVSPVREPEPAPDGDLMADILRMNAEAEAGDRE